MAYRINIYDDIAPDYGVNARSFSAELEQAEGDDIELHISSGGGDVFEGIAIMNSLRDHPGRVTVIIEGLAASAASFIAVGGGDEIIMQPSASLMIHDAWSFVNGSASDMKKVSDQLDQLSDTIAQIYSQRTGTPAVEWREAMEEESWFSAEEAVLVGLADSIKTVTANPVANHSRSKVLNSARWSGREHAPTPSIVNAHRSQKEGIMFKDLAEKLGTDEATLVNTLKGLIKNEAVETSTTIEVTYPEDTTVRPTEKVKVEPVVTSESGDPAPTDGLVFSLGTVAEGYSAEVDEAGVVEISAPSSVEPGSTAEFSVLVNENPVPLNVSVVAVTPDEDEAESEAEGETPAPSEGGSVSLDRDTYNDLRSAAQFGWEAMENKRKADQVAEVDSWVAEGRISAGLRNKAVEAMQKDPNVARDLYGSNPRGSIPRNTVGYSAKADDTGSKIEELLAKADNLRGRK